MSKALIEGTVLMATMEEDGSGIHLRVIKEDGSLIIPFVPKETWGKVPADKNPKKELKKIVDLLNGYQEDDDGTLRPLPGFQSRKVRIVQE